MKGWNIHSMLLKYESIAHLIALALLLQCTHQLCTEIVEVSSAARLGLLLLLLNALMIEGVVGLCLLLLTLLLHLTLLSLLVEGEPILMMIRLVTVMVG